MEQLTKLTTFNSFANMLEALPNDEACRKYLEQIRWNGTPTCAHCGTVDSEAYRLKTKGMFKGMYKCKSCQQRFTVTVKTMFEGSHLPLRKWFIAIYIFSSHKKGISSHQLAKDLGITQKSAWFMLGRIREAFRVVYVK
jgi:transposase-like protein